MIEFSAHAKLMIAEREIDMDWVKSALDTPDETRKEPDGNIHYIKSIAANGGRILRLVVNKDKDPNIVVTAFFDRRLREK